MLKVQHLSLQLVLNDINKGKFISQILQKARVRECQRKDTDITFWSYTLQQAQETWKIAHKAGVVICQGLDKLFSFCAPKNLFQKNCKMWGYSKKKKQKKSPSALPHVQVLVPSAEDWTKQKRGCSNQIPPWEPRCLPKGNQDQFSKGTGGRKRDLFHELPPSSW